LAQAASRANDWENASRLVSVAKDALPLTDTDAFQRLSVVQANALIESGDLVAGQDQLQSLIEQMEQQTPRNTKVLTSARHMLATSAYYAAWMMRLEGAETEDWLQEAERARQQFRWIAESADIESAQGNQDQTTGDQATGDQALSEERKTAAENLEATIRLEQMDLSTLSARPLPKNCCSNCKNTCQKKRKQAACKSKGKQDGKSGQPKKEEPDDAREEIKESNDAGMNNANKIGS
jgi:hypothetical protein